VSIFFLLPSIIQEVDDSRRKRLNYQAVSFYPEGLFSMVILKRRIQKMVVIFRGALELR